MLAFLRHFGKRWVVSGKVCPSLWFQYVDFNFTMSSAVFLRCSIRVTIELEDDNELPFLQIQVKRGPNYTFVTSINRKKTFIGLYTKWRSLTPLKYKTSLFRTLTCRCYELAPLPCCNLSWMTVESYYFKMVIFKG